MLRYEEKELVKELRNFLDETSYDIINQKLRKEQYFFDPLPAYEQVKPAVQSLDEKYRCVMELLLLGDVVKEERLTNSWGSRIVEVMEQLGIVIPHKEYIQTDGYILVSYLDRFVFVGTPFRNPNCRIKDPAVYIGIDTFRLTDNILTRPAGKILDLCTGSGIQAIFGSMAASNGIGVELNKQALPVTKFNVVLNDFEDKLEIRNGSLYEPVENEKFDRIYTNPPFIAIPDEIDYPVAGAGGTDGLDIVKDIFKGFHSHLNDGGYGIMIGEALGDEKKPFLIDTIREILGDSFETTVVLDLKITIGVQLNRCINVTKAMGKENGKSAEELFERYIKVYEEMNVTSVYSFYVKAKKVEKGIGKLNVIDFTRKWNKFSIPKKPETPYQIVPLNQFHGLVVDGKIEVSVNDTILEFIGYIDGEHSLEEIFDMVAKKDPQKFSYKNKIEFIEDVTQVCGLLEEHKLLTH